MTVVRPIAELTSLNAFLDEEGIREEMTLRAIKRIGDAGPHAEQGRIGDHDRHEPRAAGRQT